MARDKEMPFNLHHITLSLWVNSQTYSGNSCLSLPTTDAVSHRQSCTRHRYKQTGGSYFSTCRLNLAFFKSNIKDSTYNHIKSFWSCNMALSVKCGIFLDRELHQSRLWLHTLCAYWKIPPSKIGIWEYPFPGRKNGFHFGLCMLTINR